MKIAVPKRLKEAPCRDVAGYPVEHISHVDGTKLYLANDNWAQLRFSGTEPVLRLAVEADSPEKAQELIVWLKQFVSAKTKKPAEEVMRYGHFDNENREYVIDRVDIPVSWTNYIGVNRMCAVLSHMAGGYSFYRDAEHGRITHFRPNGVPMDWPGHWLYLRDDEDGDYWSICWQPVGKPLDQAKYECRHGLSYSRYRAEYKGIQAEQLIFIAREDDVEIWDVRVKTPRTARARSACSAISNGVFITSRSTTRIFRCRSMPAARAMTAASSNTISITSPGPITTMPPISIRIVSTACAKPGSGPIAANATRWRSRQGRCSGSEELTGNHCASLHKQITLEPGESSALSL